MEKNHVQLDGATELSQLQAIGRVKRVEGCFVWVETQRESGCHSCGSKKACGTSVLSQLFSPNQQWLKVENSLGAEEGQRVLLTLEDSDLIKHSLMAYGLPLLLLFVFSGIVQYFITPIWQSDVPVILAGFLGVAVGWWIVRKWYQPVMPVLEKIL